MAGSANRREVNNMLSTLRGEHFRHQQNLRQSRSHLYTYNRASSLRTLPFSLLNLDETSHSMTPETATKAPDDDPTTRRCPGPRPPKSWRLIQPSEEDMRDSPSWRLQALSVIANRVPGLSTLIPQPNAVPPLTVLCLKMVLSHIKLDANELRNMVLPYVPSHLRRQVVRSSVAPSPFPRWKLDVLYEPHGHAEGELILAGPRANLREDEFLRGGLRSANDHLSSSKRSTNGAVDEDAERGKEKEEETPEDDWDADEIPTRSLETAIFLSIRMSTTTMLTLPPTLIHLVLVDLSNPLPIHRLPKQCPQLEFLDLSYNSWLQKPSSEVLKSLERVEWGRWAELKVLGWRTCYVPPDMVEKLNRGRWNDVAFIDS